MAFTAEEILGEVEGSPIYTDADKAQSIAEEVATYLNAMIEEQGEDRDDSHPDVFDALLVFDFAYKR